MDRYGRRGWIGWGLALVASFAIIGGFLLPPFVDEAVRGLVMQAYAGVCHQLPSRSPQLGGVALAVCDRCVGIYGGLALGVLGFAGVDRWHDRVYRYAGPVLAGALVPLAMDWVGPVFGLWANVPFSRAVTGAFFGAAAGYLLARVAVRAAVGTSRDPSEGVERTPSGQQAGAIP